MNHLFQSHTIPEETDKYIKEIIEARDPSCESDNRDGL